MVNRCNGICFMLVVVILVVFVLVSLFGMFGVLMDFGVGFERRLESFLYMVEVSIVGCVEMIYWICLFG